MEKDSIINWIESNKSHLANISDNIWEYAELGLHEFKSSALLSKELELNGFDIERKVAGMPTAFVAIYGEGKPIIGIIGEYDALPNLSQKPIPKKEPLVEGGPGHGCGHNIYGTSGIGAAISVKNTMEIYNIKGTLKFFGCPAEELLIGKVFMVRAGVFNDVDAIFSHHPSSMNKATLITSNAMNSVKFEFHGIASHAGAFPDRGRSALDAVELMNIGVNYMREHISNEARINYIIEKGGGAPNIVPDFSRSWYYIRAPNRIQVEFLYDWILKIAEGASLMTGTTFSHKFVTGCYNRLHLKSMADLVVSNMRKIGAPIYTEEEMRFASKIQETIPSTIIKDELKNNKGDNQHKLTEVIMDRSIPEPWGEGINDGGSTDMGDVSWQVPTMEFGTSTWVSGMPGHSWQIVAMGKSSIAHKSLIFAAKTIACCVLDIFKNPSLSITMKKELEGIKKEQKYICPLPDNLKTPLNIYKQ